MDYTVKKLATLSGVSIRTLRFYDEIGLLKPAYVGDNNYRYYKKEQLLLLQQILFFRELGFELKQIKRIMSQNDFDKLKALRTHAQVIQKKSDRFKKLLQTIDKTIKHLEGKQTMTEKELYTGFSQEKQREYEEWLINAYGETAKELIAESKENVKNWSTEDMQLFKTEIESVNRQLLQALEQDLSVDSDEVQQLIAKHYAWINRMYTPTKEVYINLGELYCTHPDFVEYFKQNYHPDFARYCAKAMRIFAEREL